TGEGTEGFRALLAAEKLQPIVEAEDLLKDPAHILLVCFRGASTSGGSYPDLIGNLNFNIKSDFVDRGGAFFFASDQTMLAPKRVWTRVLGFKMRGSLLTADEERDDRALESCYRSRPECPFVHGLRGRSPDLFRVGSMDEHAPPLTRVATN